MNRAARKSCPRYLSDENRTRTSPCDCCGPRQSQACDRRYLAVAGKPVAVLVLLVLFAFVLPVLGFERHNVGLYADVAFTLLLISGVAIAWARPAY